MKPKRHLRNLTTLIRVFSSAIFFSMGSQHSHAANTITLQAAAPDLNGNGILGDDVAGNMAAGDFGSANSIITSGQVSTLLGSSNLTLAATNDITVNSAVSWNSAFGLTLNAGNQISINAGISNAGSGNVVLSAATYNLGAGVNFAGAIGLGTLNSNGAVGLTGTAGALTVNVQTGTLTLSGNNLADTSAVTVSSGSTLNLSAADTVGTLTSNGGTIAGTGVLTAATYGLNTGTSVTGSLGLGTLNSNGAVGITGTAGALNVNVQTGTLTLSGDNLADASAVTVSSGSTLSLSSADTIGTLVSNGGTIAGAGVLTAATYGLNTGTSVTGKLGLGTLNSNGTVGITGTADALNVNVQTGTLTLSGDNLADASAVTVSTGSTLSLSGADTVGSLTSNGGTIAGTGVLTAATYGLNTGTSVTGNLGLGTLNSNGAVSITGSVAALTVNIQSGVLTLAGNGALADGSAVDLTSATSVFSIAGISAASETVGSLAGVAGSSVVLGGKNLTTGGNNTSTTFAGNVSGTGGSFSKTGTGTQVLSGNNTYTGSTAIQAGTLQFAKQASLYNGTTSNWTKGNISVSSAATLALNVGGAGEFNTSDVTTLLGNLTVGINNNGLMGGSAIGFDTSNAAGGSFTIGDVIADSTGTGSGSLGLTKSGANTLVLSGANTYSGVTTIQGGSLVLTATGSLSSLSAVNLTGNSTTFDISAISAGGQTLASLAGVSSSSVILGGKTLTTGGDNSSTAFAGVLSGTGGSLVKTGSGTLTLGGQNLHTGGTTIQAGGIALTGSGSLADTTVLNLTGGTSSFSISGISSSGQTVDSLAGVAGSSVILGAKNLTTGASNAPTTTFAGTLSGVGGSLTKVGTGNLTLSGGNTYTGDTSIQGGTLTLTAAGSLSDLSAVSLSDASVFFNISTISASGETIGSLAGVAGSSVVLGAKNLTAGGNNSSTTFAGNVSGAGGSFSKTGTGDLVLAGTNTYTGATNVAAGTLQFGKQASLYNNIEASWTKENITVSSGASLAFNVGGTGEFTTGNVTTLLGNLTVGINNNGLMGGSTVGFDTSKAAGGSFTVADAIADSTGTGSGSLGVNKLGTKTLILSGANTYSGDTTVLGGTLQFATQSSLYNGVEASWTKENISVNSTATLAFNVGGVGEFTTGNVTTLLGNLTTSLDNNGLKGGSAIGFDTTNAAGGSFTVADVIADSTGTGAGTLGVTKLGTNSLILTGANTYTGTTNIAAGTLELSGTGSLSDSGAVDLTGSTAVFSIAGITATSETVGSLAGVAGSSVILGDRNLTVGAANSSPTFSGVLSGVGGSLTKLGTGTQSLAGVNTYTGATTVQAGTLALTGGGSIATSSVLDLGSASSAFSISGISGTGTSVNGITGVLGSTVTLGLKELTVGLDNSSSTFGGSLTGEFGRLKKVGTGSLTLTGTNTYTGTTAIQTGQLALSGGGSLADISAVNLNGATAVFSIAGITAAGETVGSLAGVSGSSVLLGTKTLSIGAANTSSSYGFAGVISGSGGLTKVGSGVEILQGANTYTGATIVSSGKLSLAGSGSVADTSALQLTGSTAVFEIRSISTGTETVASLTGVAGSTVSLGSRTLALAGNASTTFAGILTSHYTVDSITYSGGGGLSKAGTGTLTLTGANNYTGATTVSNGTLALSGGGSLHDQSSVNLSGATAVFDISGITAGGETVASLAGVAGSSVVLGNKNLTLNTYSSSTDFAGNISGVGGSLTKNSYYGSGTQILSGTNTYTGKTTINYGTLQFAKVVSLYNNDTASWTKENITVNSGGSLAVNVGGTGEFTTGNVTTLLGNLSTGINNNGLTAGSTIGFDTSNAAGGTFTVADAIANSTGTGGGTLNVTKLGANTLVFSGANTYTGSTAVLGGNLTLIGAAALSNTSQTYVGFGAVLNLSGITASSETVGSLGGSGQVILGGKNLTMGGGSFSDSFGGSISGVGASLTKIGSGYQYLSGTNDYTGTTTVNSGALVFQAPSALYNGLAASWTKENISVASGATLAFGVGGGGQFTEANITTLLANLTTGINNNGLKAGSSIGFDTGNTGSSFTYSGTIGDSTGVGAGSLGVTKLGYGTVILSGANTYTGQTNILSGTLQFANKSALYGGNAANWTKENIVVDGTLAVNVGGAGEFNSADLSTLLTNLSNNALSNGGFRYGASLGIDTSNAPGPFTYSGVIANGAQGSLGVSKLGANELILTGANTYTGSTAIRQGQLTLTGTNASGYLYVNGGTLALTGGGDLSNTADVRVDYGTFDISGITASGQTISSYSDYGYGGSSVVLGNKNLTVGAGGSYSYSTGSISGVGGSITKEGNGSFEIAGTNTYTGQTTVNGGTLYLTGSSTTNLVVSNGSSLVLSGINTGSATVNAGSLRAYGTQTGNVAVNSGGTLIVDGTVDGTVTSNGGVVQGHGTMAGGLIMNSGGKLAPGASLGALTSGTLTFNNNSTYAYEVDSSLLSAAGANGGDLQKVSGDLILLGTVNLTLTNLASSPTAFTPGTIFSLINYTGSWNGGRFTFAGQQIADEGTFTAGNTLWKLDYNAADGGLNFDNLYAGGSDSFVNMIAINPVVVIPEPGSVLIAGVSVLALLRRRRES